MDFKSFVRAQDPGAKAVLADPRLAEYANTVPIAVDGPKQNRSTFAQKEASRHLNAYGGKSDSIDWVMAAVKLIVETASNAEWGFEKDGESLVKHRSPDTPSDAKEAPMMLTKLFEEPNPYMNYEELIELTLIDYILVGNAYWLKWRTNDAGQPLALYRLAPPFVHAIPGPWGIEGYEYKVPGAGEIQIPTDQIIHFRQANPHSPYFGMGIVQGAARMLDLELALTDTQASYYEKRAQPSLVVQSDRRISKDVFKRLQGQLRGMYSGPRNAGALMVLEAGLKYQSIAPSATEAGFEPLAKMSRDRILAMFRIPPALLGINDVGASSGSASQDQRVFDTKTMRPLLNKFQGAISRSLTQPAWGVDYVIDYDYIMPPEDRLRLSSVFAALPGVRVKEVRDYAGLEPLGDENDDIILNLPGMDGTANNTHNGFPDNNLQGQAGRPPNPGSTMSIPAAGQPLPAGANAVRPVRRTSLAVGDNAAKSMKSVTEILAELEVLEVERKAMEPAHNSATWTPPTDSLVDDRTAAVDDITYQLTQDLRQAVHALERELLDELQNAVDGKAPGSKIRSRIRQSKAWSSFRDQVAKVLESASKMAISTSVMQQSRLGRIPDDEIDYDALAREIVYRTGGVRAITQTLRDDVAKKVSEAYNEGSKQDIELAIRETIDNWKASKAETIALTEATHAFNEGTLTVAELTGHTHVYVHDGEDHDEPCIEANGQVWDIGHARDNRLEHPRCRRAFTPLTSDEVV